MAFAFDCYRQLKRRLGELDAVCECAELATRELVDRTNDDEGELERLVERHGVRVNKLDPELLRLHTVHLYIVSTHSSLEGFLKALVREHPDGQGWGTGGDGSLLAKVADATGLRNSLALDVCKFYRDVRVKVVHPRTRDRATPASLGSLRQRCAADSALSRLNAPNPYEDSTFDDFVAYTRSVKQVASELCRVARPSDEWLLADARAELERTGLAGRLAQNPRRRRAALRSVLSTKYSLAAEEAARIASDSLA